MQNYSFSETNAKGAFGIAVFEAKLLEEFRKAEIPATIEPHGFGALSTAKAEEYGIENKPDLLIYKGFKEPKALIEVKYQEFNTDDSLDDFIKILTKGTNLFAICDVGDLEAYLEEKNNLNCEAFIAKVLKLERTRYPVYHYLGLQLSEETKADLEIRKITESSKDSYFIDYSKLLKNNQLFEKIKSLF
jgi:hypothetical protein